MRRFAGAVLLFVALTAPVLAQDPAETTPVQAQTAVDVSRLPVDVHRIHRELRQYATREERDGLRLRYFVDVYGQAPPFIIFGPEDDLSSGPVPGSAPTHRDMVNQVTPQDYRPALGDINNLVRWLRERMQRK
ncbi:MAG: hypothetical protein ACRD3C_25485 [Vicinamibacterales bacterium]